MRIAIIADLNDLMLYSNLLHHCIQTTGQNVGNEWWLTEIPLTELASQYKDNSKDYDEESCGIKEIVQAHLNTSSNQQAPARFTALLQKWKTLRENWLSEIIAKLKHLQAGIDRLKEAGDRVSKLEEDANKQRHELEVFRIDFNF